MGPCPPSAGTYIPSIEAIVEADPDIVLVGQGRAGSAGHAPSTGEPGHRTSSCCYKGLTFDEVYENIAHDRREYAGTRQAADELIDSMKDRISAIQDTVGDATEKPTVAFAVWLEPIYLSGNGTFSHDMMTLAMGDNALLGHDLLARGQHRVHSWTGTPITCIVSMMYLPRHGGADIAGSGRTTPSGPPSGGAERSRLHLHWTGR